MAWLLWWLRGWGPSAPAFLQFCVFLFGLFLALLLFLVSKKGAFFGLFFLLETVNLVSGFLIWLGRVTVAQCSEMLGDNLLHSSVSVLGNPQITELVCFLPG